jgi:DNA-binding transcriptional MerR regulator
MTELRSDRAREPDDRRRWVPIAEAAAIAGVSTSAIRRWQHAGRIAHRQDTEHRQGRRLVDLDEVLVERAARAEARSNGDPGNVIRLESAQQTAAELHERLEHAAETAEDAEARAAAAEAEVERLRRRLGELETWLAASSRFEEIEQVQLGRLLAVASAEREARRLPLIASSRTLLLALYVVVVAAFIVLLFVMRP